jgi:uncharacterized protein YndB with AHSA1/START domain
MSSDTILHQRSVEITIEAPPEPVYKMLSTLERMGEWSPECERIEWREPSAGPVVGARFRGHNRKGIFRWRTENEVETAEPGREFAWVVRLGNAKLIRWRYTMEPRNGVTRLRETFELLRTPVMIEVARNLFWILQNGSRRRRMDHLQKGMEQTLARIKAAVERQRRRGELTSH